MLSYNELITLKSFDERLKYLTLSGTKHASPRRISTSFFKNPLWLSTREDIITRDLGCDLGVFGIYIFGSVYVHHIDPITEDDILQMSYKLFDPNNLISSSLNSHNIIHYKPEEEQYVERTSGDTKLW